MKKIPNFKGFFNKPAKIVTSILLLSGIITISTAIPLGIWSYNRAYYQKLNEKSQNLSISQTENPFENNLGKFFDNLFISNQFKELSASTAFELAKSKIYNLDLLTLINLDKLYQKNYQISYDLSNATASGTAIKNIVFFIRTSDQRQIFSKAVEIKGFSDKNIEKNLAKFEIDEKKSSISIKPQNFLSFAEFSKELQNQFIKTSKTQKQTFIAFEEALIQLGGSYNLVNSLGLPTFIHKGQILEPKIFDNNLNFTNQGNKNYLNFIFTNEGKKTEIPLEINGITPDLEIKNEIIKWIKAELEEKIKLKESIQAELIRENLSLAKSFYVDKNNNPWISTTKNFENLFDYVQSEHLINTNKIKNYITNINFKIKKNSEIPALELNNLLKDDKIRLEINVDISKWVQQKLIKILSFKFDWDLKPDLNQYARIFAQNLPEPKSEVFLLRKDENSAAWTSKKLVNIINKIKEFNNELDPENPDIKLVSQLYLLDFGKIGDEIAIENYKRELIRTAKILKNQLVKVQEFSDDQVNKAQNNEKSLGKAIWKVLNIQRNLINDDISSDFILDNKEGDFTIEFSLISNKNKQKLATRKIKISNIVSSEMSAFDDAAKFYPTFFLDGKSSFSKSDNKKGYEIIDLSDNNIHFEDDLDSKNQLTQEGFKLTNPIKFQQNQSKTKENIARTVNISSPSFKSAPFSRLDSGLIYLAFKPKNINDYKKHYLLADSDGNGLFIQKIKNFKFINKNTTIQGIAGLKTEKTTENSDITFIKPENLDQKNKDETQQKQVDGYFIGLDFKQIKNFKSFQSYLYQNKKSLYSLANLFPPELIDKQAVILGPNSWKPIKNFSAEINQNLDNLAIVELANRTGENRFYRQELRNSSPFLLEKSKEIIEDDQDIVLEIIKTPWSVEISAFSSSNYQLNSKTSLNLNGKTIYNINPVSQKWSPFPNYLNLDWAQIGPNPKKTTDKNGSNNEKINKNSSIILKGIAVYNDPELTTKTRNFARDQIRNAFIKAYIK